MNLSIVSAKYVAPLKVELHFNDDTIKTMLLHFMPKLHLPPLACRGTFCGFSARTYLYRIFKLKEGCAPTEWREKMTENVASEDKMQD